MVKVMFAAGGTGGHIYPALAVASALRRIQPQSEINFVGTASGFENTILPQQGYAVQHLPIGRLNSNVSLKERLQTLFLLPLAFFASWRLLKKYQPDFVMGFGGHASGPLLLVASLCGFKTAIWEPNAIPGLANRWLSRFVDECFVVFAEAKSGLKNSKVKVTGVPVREEIENAFTAIKANATKPWNVLVFGGSQGARALNTAVVGMVAELVKMKNHELDQFSLVHQTGRADFERTQKLYLELSLPAEWQSRIEIRPYLDDMHVRYRWANLVVCRSGTGTISELAACNKPALFVPLPTAADDHQMKNAQSLKNSSAAEILAQKDLSPETLTKTVLEILRSPNRLEKMGEGMGQFHKTHSADELAAYILTRIQNAVS